MHQNLENVLYLAFRLAPFILVSFFTLQSLFNWDLKGIVYLVGLVLASAITILFGRNKNNFGTSNSETLGAIPNPRCNVITLGDNGGVVSYFPLSIMVYSYTLFYLLVFMLNLANTSNSKGVLNDKPIKQSSINAVMLQNIPVLMLFPLLILMETAWIVSNNCLSGVRPLISILCAILIGGVVGVLWAVFITSMNKPELQYINKMGLEVCNQPSKMVYRCRVSNAKGIV
jgi:hypothetical protein